MKKRILLIALIGMSFNLFAQDETVNGNLKVNGSVKLGSTSAKIYWDWPERTIEQYSSDGGLSRMIRFRNSMDASNPDGGFDFANYNGTSILRIINHKVGIGTTSPTEKLNVKGNIKATGHIKGSQIGVTNIVTNYIPYFNGTVFDDSNIYNLGNNVGIGTSNPSSKLQLMNGNDGISFDSSDDWIGIGFNRSVRNGEIFDTAKSGWQFTARDDRFSLEGYNGAFSNLLHILKNGNVGIGTITTGNHKLAVEGSIGAREVKVTLDSWSDFVFKKTYKLPTLEEVEKYIKEKGHLKDIPSAKDVKENGIYLGEMNSKLLQKIEELTLYTIQQEKRINKLESQNTKLIEIQKRLDKLEKK